jgi:acyl carrier protein
MSDYSKRVNALSPNKQSLLALKLDKKGRAGGLAKTHEQAYKRLVAYIVPTPGHQPTNKQLLDTLKHKLPEYMIPSSFISLNALPIGPNGKVDRKALTKMEESPPSFGDDYVAPRTELERELTQLWADVLRVEKVGIHDNFFDLGGHSLLATQLISRIREAFLVDIPLRSIFEAPTVAGLSKIIVQQQIEQAGSEDLAEVLAQLDSSNNGL